MAGSTLTINLVSSGGAAGTPAQRPSQAPVIATPPGGVAPAVASPFNRLPFGYPAPQQPPTSQQPFGYPAPQQPPTSQQPFAYPSVLAIPQAQPVTALTPGQQSPALATQGMQQKQLFSQQASAITQGAAAAGIQPGKAATGAIQGFAAGGPEGAIVGALVGKAQEIRDEFDKVFTTIGDFSKSIISFDASAFERGVVELTDNIPVVGGAVKRFGAFVLDMADAVERSAKHLSQYSGDLAAQQAQFEARTILRDVARAQRLGPDLVAANEARFQLENKVQNFMDATVPLLLRLLTLILEGINTGGVVADKTLEVAQKTAEILRDLVPNIGNLRSGAQNAVNNIGRIRQSLREILDILNEDALDPNNNFIEQFATTGPNAAMIQFAELAEVVARMERGNRAPTFPGFGNP
jgi:methyl-accepting chemotaxis protein